MHKDECINVEIPAEYYDKALAFCNNRRAARRLEPWTTLPPGRRAVTGGCPCSQAVDGLHVGSTSFWYLDESGMNYGSAPHDIGAFIVTFDGGDFISVSDPKFNQLALPVRVPAKDS